jgi:hypothetical protein
MTEGTGPPGLLGVARRSKYPCPGEWSSKLMKKQPTKVVTKTNDEMANSSERTVEPMLMTMEAIKT